MTIPRLIIAGCRDFHCYATLEAALQKANATPERVKEVVSGGADGVDRLGERWAREHGIKVKRFRADWDKYGRGAGPQRNKEMARYSSHLLALWDGQSRGTRHMIGAAKIRELKVFVYRLDLVVMDVVQQEMAKLMMEKSEA